MTALTTQHCLACEGGVPPLAAEERGKLLAELDAHWQLSDDEKQLEAEFTFRNFHEVMAFANAVAFVAHRENHHPDMMLSYRHCRVLWTTHAVQGLTLNDFICAAKTDALLQKPDSGNPTT